MDHWQGEGCHTEIEATKGGIAVRRVVHNVVVDRYNTVDLKTPPRRPGPPKWIQKVVALAGNEKSPDIPVPTIPALAESLFDKVARLEAEVKQLNIEIANRSTSELFYANRVRELESIMGPDMYCVTNESGDCISNHPKCMHQIQPAPEPEDVTPLLEPGIQELSNGEA